MSLRPPWVCEFVCVSVLCVSVQGCALLSRPFVESRRMPFLVANLSPCVGSDVSLLEKSTRKGESPFCHL